MKGFAWALFHSLFCNSYIKIKHERITCGITKELHVYINIHGMMGTSKPGFQPAKYILSGNSGT